MSEVRDGAADCSAKVLVRDDFFANAVLIFCVDLEVATLEREISDEICQDVSGNPEVAFGPDYDEGKGCECGHVRKSTSEVPQISPYGLCCQTFVYPCGFSMSTFVIWRD